MTYHINNYIIITLRNHSANQESNHTNLFRDVLSYCLKNSAIKNVVIGILNVLLPEYCAPSEFQML